MDGGTGHLEIAGAAIAATGNDMWQSIATAPYERDLELAVIDRDGTHALVFPCQRMPAGWVKSSTRERVEVSPTHWREWLAK